MGSVTNEPIDRANYRNHCTHICSAIISERVGEIEQKEKESGIELAKI